MIFQHIFSVHKKTLKHPQNPHHRRLSGHFSIFCRTTFAWFTSKDEVTNRLTANADYGVSIIESFTPPKNWIPGQEVNKDVYATNTGNIGAYVKETVSGALTVTAEKDTTTKTANSIKLTEEERYAVEAGAYLAYKPATSTKVVGNAVVVRPADETFPRMEDFTPDAEGLYVFRRSIGVNPATPGTETFEYDGYYFDGTDYYRISNLTYTLASAANQAADGNNHDGDLATATAGFVELETKTVDPTKLEYKTLTTGVAADETEAAANVELDKQYLVATYDVGSANSETKLKALAAAYDKAIHDFEYAQEMVDAATRANTASTGTTAGLLTTLNTEKDDYDAAIAAYDAAVRAKAATAQTKANAQAAKDRAVAAKSAADAALSNATTEQTNAANAITAAAYSTDDTAFLAELQAWWTSSGEAGALDRASLTVAQLNAFKTWIDTNVATGETHTNYTLAANKLIADKKVADATAAQTAAQTAVTNAEVALTAATTAYDNAQTDLNTATIRAC